MYTKTTERTEVYLSQDEMKECIKRDVVDLQLIGYCIAPGSAFKRLRELEAYDDERAIPHSSIREIKEAYAEYLDSLQF